MAEDKKIEEKNKKEIMEVEKEIAKDIEKIEEKVEEGKITEEEASDKIEKKVEEETEAKKPESKKDKVKPKDLAVARAYSLKISPKQTKYICRMIAGRTPDKAISMLVEVTEGKRSVQMPSLEVAHQKGKGIAGAKFPKNACLEIIEIVRQVKANAVINQVENPVIVIAKSDRASRPHRRSGQRGRRTHIYLEVKDKTKLKKGHFARNSSPKRN